MEAEPSRRKDRVMPGVLVRTLAKNNPRLDNQPRGYVQPTSRDEPALLDQFRGHFIFPKVTYPFEKQQIGFQQYRNADSARGHKGFYSLWNISDPCQP